MPLTKFKLNLTYSSGGHVKDMKSIQWTDVTDGY